MAGILLIGGTASLLLARGLASYSQEDNDGLSNCLAWVAILFGAAFVIGGLSV